MPQKPSQKVRGSSEAVPHEIQVTAAERKYCLLLRSQAKSYPRYPPVDHCLMLCMLFFRTAVSKFLRLPIIKHHWINTFVLQIFRY